MIKLKVFVTGSTLVRGVEPQDLDLVHFFDTKEEMAAFTADKEKCSEFEPSCGDGPHWESVRVGNVNYICTTSLEFFYRFKAFSGALAHLQLKNKDDRKALCQACREWEPAEKPKEDVPTLGEALRMMRAAALGDKKK